MLSFHWAMLGVTLVRSLPLAPLYRSAILVGHLLLALVASIALCLALAFYLAAA